MKNHINVNTFYRNRKGLCIIFLIILLFVSTLTIVYAALSTTLNIIGQTEISSASWDVYLDNVQLNSNSVTSNVPIITDKTKVNFTTNLNNPGDYYEFTVDVVNNGTIDAMIDSVVKTPELSDNQKKYLNYIVEYQNGESINTKQLVEVNSFVRLRVKIGFRNDISAADIPQTGEVLNLSFTINYVQSDDSSDNSIIDNSGKLIKVVSGNFDTVGSEICVGKECFYVISSNENSVTLFAKYNLFVGNECTSAESSSCVSYGDNATGIQDSTMIGYGGTPRKGTIEFASTNYWENNVSTYPAYVYNENSSLYKPLENYKKYLERQGAVLEEIRIIKVEELEKLGCSISNLSCSEAPEWVYAVSYWTGDANNGSKVWRVTTNESFNYPSYNFEYTSGVRPVITISKLYF